MKQCSKCLESKDLESFYKKKGTKDGLFKYCIICHKDITKAQNKKRYENIEFAKKESKRVLEWRSKNPEKHSKSVKNYAKSNKSMLVAKAMKHRCNRRNRVPKWLSENEYWMIEEAYKLADLRTKITGFIWHVDHIIPLQGKKVSGLHTPYNLQVIPGSINQSKGNAFITT